jgi:hypothetical protein
MTHPVLHLTFEDPAWPDLQEREIIHTTDVHVAGLEGGMGSGAPSIALRIDLPDGRSVVAETSLALFLTCADGLRARFGDPRPSMP